MKSIKHLSLFLSGIFLISFACTPKDQVKTERLKYMLVEGDTTTRFIYNAEGRISEIENVSRYEKFHYDKEGRLVKHEHASDARAHWADRAGGKQEMMTAKNSTVNLYRIVEYDEQNRPSQEKEFVSNLTHPDSAFKFVSATHFVYNSNNKVSRRDTYNSEGVLYEYSVYKYDEPGNRKKETYYFQFPGDSSLKLMSETTYKFDTKTNPNKTIKGLQTGDYTDNLNNIIERKITCYIPDCGNTLLNSTFTYNEKGLPLSCSYSNNSNSYTYIYE